MCTCCTHSAQDSADCDASSADEEFDETKLKGFLGGGLVATLPLIIDQLHRRFSSKATNYLRKQTGEVSPRIIGPSGMRGVGGGG